MKHQDRVGGQTINELHETTSSLIVPSSAVGDQPAEKMTGRFLSLQTIGGLALLRSGADGHA